ncbi:hypothetical protein [uncultured Fibrella sp.]|uniref:hypothetical protein n=1 Tax=uncultured Fibrella sp. TaxID=1284596 RepID=UPI0035C9A2DC
MIWQQKLTGVSYNSDVQHAHVHLNDDVDEGRVGSVKWNDLLVHATAFPELKETAHGLVKIHLGYLPLESVLMPFEAYLRALVHQYWQGSIEQEDFLDQIEDHIKLIRNEDMKYNTCLTYDEAIYRNYENTYLPYGYMVRDRLSQFLGYVPQLEHSLIAELWMRDIMAEDTFQLPETIDPVDIRAMTLIKYREVLLRQGKAAADRSPLWA